MKKIVFFYMIVCCVSLSFGLPSTGGSGSSFESQLPLNVQGGNCDCSNFILDAYETVLKELEESVEGQINAIEDKLIPNIRQNISDIQEQNSKIKQLIEAERKKALQNAEILFTLEKIIELKSAGEL